MRSLPPRPSSRSSPAAAGQLVALVVAEQQVVARSADDILDAAEPIVLAAGTVRGPLCEVDANARAAGRVGHRVAVRAAVDDVVAAAQVGVPGVAPVADQRVEPTAAAQHVVARAADQRFAAVLRALAERADAAPAEHVAAGTADSVPAPVS